MQLLWRCFSQVSLVKSIHMTNWRIKENMAQVCKLSFSSMELMLTLKSKMSVGPWSGSLWQHQSWSLCQHYVLWGLGHLPCPSEQEIMRNSHGLEEFVGVASLEGYRDSTSCHSTMIWHFQWEKNWNLSAMPESGGGKKIGTIHEAKNLESIKSDFNK